VTPNGRSNATEAGGKYYYGDTGSMARPLTCHSSGVGNCCCHAASGNSCQCDNQLLPAATAKRQQQLS